MAEPMQSFEAALETDMRDLALEIKKSRENPEYRNAAERDLVKEAIRAFPSSNAAPVVAPAAQTATQPKDNPSSPLPAYAQNAAPEVKLEIEYLIDLALREGISKAMGEAAKSPYFVQDAFHDALAGRLYPELQKRGIVK